MKLTLPDHARIAGAIAEAERTTSGEIYCVCAHSVSSYRDVSLGWAASAALILPLILIPFGFEAAWMPGLADTWETAHLAARNVTIGQTLAAYAVLQAATFLTVFLVTSIPTVRRWVTPASVRRQRVRRAALQQFLAHGLHVTQARTGVLIFAAMSDHRVEVIADEGIHSLVDQDVWAEAAAALVTQLKARRPADGFVAAIQLCGEVLSRHFPPRPDNINEVPDRLVEI